MGLSEQNLEWFERACNVELRQANFSRYPEHVTDFLTYAFKPLIIAEALREFGAVFWVDTSAVFQKDRPIEGLLERIGNMQKSSEDPDFFLFYTLRHSINSTTHPDMFRYLPPYQNEVTRNRLMLAAEITGFVFRYVLCALEKNCIAPKEAQLSCDKNIFQGEYGGCHRYDQSAINLIIAPYEKSRLQPEIVDGFISPARGFVVEDNTKDKCDLQLSSIKCVLYK